MSMVDQGISRLNWVCRCTHGLCKTLSPAIHIFAGENVCIQVIRPMQLAAAFACVQRSRMASGVVSTGLKTTLAGIFCDSASDRAIVCESSATCRSVSSP